MLEVRSMGLQFCSDAGVIQALSNISFSIRPGEKVALVGSSGCGKSSLAKALTCGYARTHGARLSGEIIWEGKPLFSTTSSTQNQIALISQNPLHLFDPIETIKDALLETIFSRAQPPSYEQAIREIESLFTSLQLTTDQTILQKYPHQLSGGMLQRVAIALSLLAHPSLLIADEITSSLDPFSTKQLLLLLQTLPCSLLFITHDVSLIPVVANRVLVMKEGRIVHETDASSFKRNSPPIFIDSPLKPSASPLLSLDKVSLWIRSFFSKTPILKEISFTLYENETIFMIGKSGSGKTSLAKTLAGFFRISSGTILLRNRPLSGFSSEIHYLFQNPYTSTNPRHKVKDILEEPCIHSGRTISQEQLVDALEKVGLDPSFLHRELRHLSGGQRQRVSIARAVIAKPKLLICDEPTSALDEENEQEVLELLFSLKSEGWALLIITHDLSLLHSHKGRVVVIQEGAICDITTMKEIENKECSENTLLLIQSHLSLSQTTYEKV